ncbi:hypothetical protein K439DRAFT_370392 [Ramaria rubella]|nr:hypothetical protein K439DRAFT_370392 [Ramaria rubella]
MESSLKFSKNVICIDVSAPDLTELVFIDLPGIIQNADEDLVNLVEDVTKEYIQGDSIILVAIPMTDEMENQKAARLARNEDPERLRTIDLIAERSTRLRENWLAELEGKGPNPLVNGYYCTRQPDDAERAAGITHKDACIEEARFFETTDPWKSSTHKQNLGVPRLAEKLSALLSQRIAQSLPRIRETLLTALENTNKDLANLPQALTGNPSTKIFYLINQFCKDLQAYVDGARGAETLIQQSSKEYNAFKKAILSTAPGPPVDPFSHIPLPLDPYLEDIRMQISIAKTRELPNNVPYHAKLQLIDRFTQKWFGPADKCLEGVREKTVIKVLELLQHHFKRFSRLENLVTPLILEEVGSFHSRTKTMVKTLLTFENSPYTQNTEDYTAFRDKKLSFYKAERNLPKGGLYHNAPYQQNALTALRNIGYNVEISDLEKLRSRDQFEEELIVAAEVDAFFQVSHKRIIDTIPQAIDHIFLRALARDMDKTLMEKLGVSDEKKASSLLAEDIAIVSKRRELMARKEKLEK